MFEYLSIDQVVNESNDFVARSVLYEDKYGILRIDRMKRKPDGSMATDGDAMLIIDDKPNRHLIFIKIVW